MPLVNGINVITKKYKLKLFIYRTIKNIKRRTSFIILLIKYSFFKFDVKDKNHPTKKLPPLKAIIASTTGKEASVNESVKK
ncbi:hypothetical protein ABE36_00850 [Bacillus subtilis]|nr:hypothetical protein AWV81_10655 [Bacillus subtilis subsp. natto]AOS68151.1 hypothetical protein A4A60_11010 [Bacillus subtilis]POD86319.1 hypothetical protein S101384_01502 [Bacillus subtilis subsp. subtilis]API94691.1 hypothetical protein BKP58_01680 [Bacillus subtilis]MBG9559793.1 hypothetical protein [Bacillus subtilis]